MSGPRFMSKDEFHKVVEDCKKDVAENSRYPHKGFDKEEIIGMTSEELKEYKIDFDKAMKWFETKQT